MHGNNTKSRFVITMESPIMGPQRGGHNGNDLSTKEMLQGPKCSHFPILLIHLNPLKSRQPLYKGQMAGLNMSFVQRFHCLAGNVSRQIHLISFVYTCICAVYYIHVHVYM